MPTCAFTGQDFQVSAQEKVLRKKLGVEGDPIASPSFRFLQLGAFWQHWNLHHRVCAYSQKPLISVFGPDCPYPVWHKDEWIQHADPPSADFDASRKLFEQMWEFFQQCPIPHNVGAGNENCEYTDDWWYSRDCYLSHSGVECENLRYCYRALRCKDSWFTVFSDRCELCTDVVNCISCFACTFLIDSKQCRNSAFLYDCRNCEDCMFCWNLSNEQYCFMNEQLTKEEYEFKRKEWDLSSERVYQKALHHFHTILREKAWYRCNQNFLCEDVTGDYVTSSKDVENCYFLTENCRDCINSIRGGVGVKDCLDVVCPLKSERIFYSTLIQDLCYDVKFCYNLIQCKDAEYSGFCFQCSDIFGCFGLVGKKYHIFNKPYSPEAYRQKRAEIINHMKKTGEYGQFFPGYFSAVPYEESFSRYYFPLTKDQIKQYGFRLKTHEEKRVRDCDDVSSIPDHAEDAKENIDKSIFWDEGANRPFQIQSADVALAKKLHVPLPREFYISRLQRNFRYMPFSGAMRSIACAACHKPTQTGQYPELDSRILCELCYQKKVIG